MNREVYEAFKVIADECNKNPMVCDGCAFECNNGITSYCLLRKYTPGTLFRNINKMEVYEFNEEIRV